MVLLARSHPGPFINNKGEKEGGPLSLDSCHKWLGFVFLFVCLLCYYTHDDGMLTFVIIVKGGAWQVLGHVMPKYQIV
jgi:hypothetical protein